MGEDYSSIRVADFVNLGIVLHATCLNCGRDRLLPSLLAFIYKPEDRLHQAQLDTLSKRMLCGNCKTYGPKLELVKQ